MSTATTSPARRSVLSFLKSFERRASSRDAEPGWLAERRRAALALFESRGLPTTRDEDWRFTNVSPIAETVFSEALPSARLTDAEVTRWTVPGADALVLVFLDGRHVATRSRSGVLPKGLTITPLRASFDNPVVQQHLEQQAREHGDDRSFAALNTALFEDGALIDVAPGAIVEEPVQILNLVSDQVDATVVHPRALVVAGAGSQCTVIELFGSLGAGRYFTNAVTEIAAADGAVVDHYRLQRESDEAFHIGLVHVRVGRSASVSSHAVTLGGAISRLDAVAVLADEGADCTLNGFYYADASRLVDNHTEIDHAMPHGTSHELYKGILADRARAVFNGRIRVRPDAQKTDAKQTNKTLLLSDNAQINTKPQLEIFANDVKCTHGATVGQLNADAMFYLRARGIDEESARNMLIHAFASDVIAKMKSEPVRLAVERQLALRLPGGAEEQVLP